MKEKSVVTEGYVLKNKIYRYMNAIWKNEKNVHIDKLNDRFNKCNSAYHITTKSKAIGVKWITNIDFDVERNDKDLKFKFGDHVRVSKY